MTEESNIHLEEEEDGESGDEFSFYDEDVEEDLLEGKTHNEEIRLYAYSEADEEWEKCFLEDEKTIPSKVENLSIATQNVWFGKYFISKRTTSILDSIAEDKPHFVCLQELTLDFMHIFKDHEGMRENYLISDKPEYADTFTQYGAGLLVRKDLRKSIEDIGQLHLPSRMGRSLIHCEVHLLGNGSSEVVKMNVGSIHLESLRNPIYRRTQLRLISDKIQCKYSDCLLCGDFNFPARRNYFLETKPLENDFFKSSKSGDLRNYSDVWAILNYSEDPSKDKIGLTKDFTNNKMFAAVNPGKKNFGHFRYDRIMLKSSIYEPKECILWNNKQISGLDKIVFPSDHFGVMATLQLKKK